MTDSLAERVAAEVRGQLGRRLMTQTRLANLIDKPQTYVSRRLGRNQIVSPLDLDDVERIATVMEMTPLELIERAINDRNLA